MTHESKRQLAGWIAVALATAVACFWAFWGIIENFHEGWFNESLLLNIGLMLLQYLAPMLIFLALTLLAIAFPRVGGAAFALAGTILALALFGWDDATAMQLVILPMLLLGVLFWYGRPRPRQRAMWVAVALPTLTLVVCGAGPALRVATRVDDHDLRARVVQGDGVRLRWAPDGPGWPRQGTTWHEAVRRCDHLSEDGLELAETPQQIWRLPTVEEAVRSMSRHGANSGGTWDSEARRATYRTRPDKETPLWNLHSQVIYWWTATSMDDERAYMIVYDGKVWPRPKRFAPDYLGYRCVRPATDAPLASAAWPAAS